MRLLLVEDDPILGDGLQVGLRETGYTVDWVTDGEAAEAALQATDYAVMVLDIGLPKESGLSVLKKLRGRGRDLPVLILTARDTVSDRVIGLDNGADDYMIKPFDLDELCARLRAVQRRRAGRGAPLLTHRDIVLDPAGRTVSRAGKGVDLSKREFMLLQVLLENIGKVLSRNKIEDHLYAWDEEVESNAVEVHVHHLRKKLGSDLIRTQRGVGYIIDKDE